MKQGVVHMVAAAESASAACINALAYPTPSKPLSARKSEFPELPNHQARAVGTSTESALVDPQLAFLARAHARFILVEAGEMSLDEALDGLVEPTCDCQRWPLAAQWERTHPPVVRARTAERRR
jgi:hypothetical protein